MKTVLSILLVSLVLSSCRKEEPKWGSVTSVGSMITVQNKAGIDLLNPSNSGAFLQQNIKIFYLINGVKEEVFHGNYDYPRNFYIEEVPDGSFRMCLGMNHSPTEEYPITYVQWSENDTDTLKTKIYREGGLTSCEDIWLNNKLVWKNEDLAKRERSINIIK